MFIPSLYTFKSLSGPFVSSFPFNFYCFLSQPLSSDNLSSIRVPTVPLVSSSCYCPFSFTFSRRRFHHRSHFVVRFISSSFASLPLSLSFGLCFSVSLNVLSDFSFCRCRPSIDFKPRKRSLLSSWGNFKPKRKTRVRRVLFVFWSEKWIKDRRESKCFSIPAKSQDDVHSRS